MQPSPRIALVAGETSGDLLAGLLLDGLRTQWPQLSSMGIGGARMQERGFTAWWPSERLAVHGYSAELARRLLGIVRIRRQLRQRLLTTDRPEVFIGVDAPDFNLGLEARLRSAGIKTVHFVCPSIWAWRPERVHQIRRACDHVLCLFPFEPELLARHGIAATFVGHPLARVIPLQPDRQAARLALGLQPEGEVLAVLPGSRASEVAYLAPTFFAAAALVRQARPGVRLLVPAVPALQPRLEQLAHASGIGDALTIVAGQSHTVLAACDATLIASGTATLEAALFKRPMVITYSMHWLSWLRMQRMAYQPWVGLPNILLRGFVVPELLQDSCTPEAVAQAAQQWLDSPSRCEGVGQRFAELHHLLRQDTARRASDAVAQVLGR